MYVRSARPNLNTSVLKWKRVLGIEAARTKAFAEARIEENMTCFPAPESRMIRGFGDDPTGGPLREKVVSTQQFMGRS